MKIRAKLVIYSMVLIIVTAVAGTLGSTYLTWKQTVRQNSERLENSAESLEKQLLTSIATIERQLISYCNYTSTPLKVIATISRLKEKDKEIELGSDFLVDGLYALGNFSDVESFAFYVPYDNSGKPRWIYSFSSRHAGVIGLDYRNEVNLYTPNTWDTFDQQRIERPNLFPDIYPNRQKVCL